MKSISSSITWPRALWVSTNAVALLVLPIWFLFSGGSGDAPWFLPAMAVVVLSCLAEDAS